MNSPIVFLRSKSPKKNGEIPIYIVVNADKKTVWFNTGASVLPENWNDKDKKIKGNTKKAKDDNLIIERVLATINDIMVRYRLSNVLLTAELLKNEYKNPSRRIDFYAFADEIIKKRKPDIANQTYKNITSSIKKMKEYQPRLSFSEITPEWLTEFARHLKTKVGNDQNTVYSMMKNLKALINTAIRYKIIDSSPFDQYQTKKVQTDRVYLTRDELKILWNLYNSNKLSVDKNTNLRHFLFMCFTGLRISDFKRLTKYSVHDGTLVFAAEKTKREKRIMIKVPLTEHALQLIKDENSPNQNLFNPISEQKFNKYIKDICLQKKIKKDVSLHAARHTFATIFIEQTNDVVSLQKLLGHSRITDTMIYVHMSDESVRESMTRFKPLE
jgi:integrase/recombinase XerD